MSLVMMTSCIFAPGDPVGCGATSPFGGEWIAQRCFSLHRCALLNRNLSWSVKHDGNSQQRQLRDRRRDDFRMVSDGRLSGRQSRSRKTTDFCAPEMTVQDRGAFPVFHALPACCFSACFCAGRFLDRRYVPHRRLRRCVISSRTLPARGVSNFPVQTRVSERGFSLQSLKKIAVV